LGTRKKQLEDWEVAIIRAMIADGDYTKQQIVAFFSRPERSINQARISEIEANNERYDGIKAASAVEMNKFIADWNQIAFPVAPKIDLGPVHPDTLTKLFPLKPLKAGAPEKLAVAETDTTEGKESFNWGSKEKYSKTFAGFANNKGGYILFGVKDGSFEVVGIPADRMEKFDLRKANQYLTRTYNQAFRIEIGSFGVNGKTIGTIYIHPASDKPVICKVDDGKLKSGDIFYRYPGETRRIQAPELEFLLKMRDRVSGGNLLEFAQKAQSLGMENAAIFDLKTGEVDGKNGSFLIDENLLPHLKFINEGQFDETEGAPSLKLLGELQTLAGDTVTVERKVKGTIAERDIIEDFIKQSDVGNPRAYIEQLCHIQPVYLPIYYYAHLMGISVDGLIDVLSKVDTHYKTRVQKHIERITNAKPASALPARNGLEEIIANICGDEAIQIDDVENAKLYLKAIRLVGSADVSLERLLSILDIVFVRFGSNAKLRSAIRYAVADVDLKWFRELVANNPEEEK
tara:strand:+ start:197572 stop:199119 length:1548 start_codon:yes stop_codon:yes gene_type:complete